MTARSYILHVSTSVCQCGEGTLSDEDGCCVTCGGDLFDEGGRYIHEPKTCTARPWRSCSRPDGTPLRHWDRGYLWTDTGESCDPSEARCPVCRGSGFLHDIATRTAVECFCIEDARRDGGTP